MSYSLGKIRLSSKPFDIYKGPNSNLEIIKPWATKANLLLMRIRIKTKAYSKKGPLWVREEIKSEYKACLKRKLK
jgi:hypothetical protein